MLLLMVTWEQLILAIFRRSEKHMRVLWLDDKEQCHKVLQNDVKQAGSLGKERWMSLQHKHTLTMCRMSSLYHLSLKLCIKADAKSFILMFTFGRHLAWSSVYE